jgi:hypothetical protein
LIEVATAGSNEFDQKVAPPTDNPLKQDHVTTRKGYRSWRIACRLASVAFLISRTFSYALDCGYACCDITWGLCCWPWARPDRKRYRRYHSMDAGDRPNLRGHRSRTLCTLEPVRWHHQCSAHTVSTSVFNAFMIAGSIPTKRGFPGIIRAPFQALVSQVWGFSPWPRAAPALTDPRWHSRVRSSRGFAAPAPPG